MQGYTNRNVSFASEGNIHKPSAILYFDIPWSVMYVIDVGTNEGANVRDIDLCTGTDLRQAERHLMER